MTRREAPAAKTTTPYSRPSGGIMPTKSQLAAIAATLCLAAPAMAQQAQKDFPDGPGKQTFVAVCGACHEATRARAGYNAAGWNTIQSMMENMEAPVPPEEWPTLAAYLIKKIGRAH